MEIIECKFSLPPLLKSQKVYILWHTEFLVTYTQHSWSTMFLISLMFSLSMIPTSPLSAFWIQYLNKLIIVSQVSFITIFSWLQIPSNVSSQKYVFLLRKKWNSNKIPRMSLCRQNWCFSKCFHKANVFFLCKWCYLQNLHMHLNAHIC